MIWIRFLAFSLVCSVTAVNAQTMPLVVQLAKAEKWDQLIALLDDGFDPNSMYGDGTAAIHWSSYHDNLEATEALIAAGSDINSTTDLGVTPLWLAAENGSASMTSLLLRAGADPTIALLSGETVVMTAAQSGNSDVLRELLAAGANPNVAVTREQTALMWAANRGNSNAVEALIEFGADVNARSLVREQYVKSEKEQDSSDEYKHWVQLGGNNALMFAARAGSLESARHLIEGGAEVNALNAFGISALILAVHSGNLDLVKLLIHHDADLDQDTAGHTALHVAVLRGNLGAVNVLIDAGADLESLVQKATPVRRQSTDYNFHDALIGSSPLWLAARFSEPEIMQALIDAGADVNTTNHMVYPAQRLGENYIVDEGKISLVMAAVGMGHRRLRISWWTPERRAGRLDRSREEFILDAVRTAVRAGASVNTTDIEGQSALTFARARGYETVVAYLQSTGLSG